MLARGRQTGAAANKNLRARARARACVCVCVCVCVRARVAAGTRRTAAYGGPDGGAGAGDGCVDGCSPAGDSVYGCIPADSVYGEAGAGDGSLAVAAGVGGSRAAFLSFLQRGGSLFTGEGGQLMQIDGTIEWGLVEAHAQGEKCARIE